VTEPIAWQIPYEGFKFRLRIGGRYVAGISKASAVAGKEGEPRRRRSPAGFEAVTLERGITHDPDFEAWCRMGSKLATKPSDEVRRDVTIEQYNEAGSLSATYRFFRCWVSEYQATPDLDANASAVVIRSLKLENEGWERR
jgi:phage tail-like protein